MTLHKLTLLCTAFFGMIALTCPASHAEKWVREGTGLVFSLNSNNVDIVRVGDSGSTFRAYYMKPGAIYSALSDNDGVSFVEEGMVVSGSHPAVVKLEDGSIRLYYTDSDNNFVSAVSNDGVGFTPEDGIRLDNSKGKIVHPSIVVLPSDGYRMYFDKEEDSMVGFGQRILSAVSQDGLTWTHERGSRIAKTSKKNGFEKLKGPDLVYSPFVTRRNNRYYMYFTADNEKKKKNGVWRARSRDGKKFNLLNKVLGLDPEVADPSPGPGGTTGNPQDTFIIDTSTGSKRMYIWQAQQGYISAAPQ